MILRYGTPASLSMNTDCHSITSPRQQPRAHPCYVVLKLLFSLLPPAIVLASISSPMVGASASDTGLLLGVHNLDTGKDYASIQEAIDDPSTARGTTIVVDSGTYIERITVNKTLNIKGRDTGGGIPVIIWGRDVVNITASGVTVEGLNVTNAVAAAISIFSDNNTITGNHVHGILVIPSHVHGILVIPILVMSTVSQDKQLHLMVCLACVVCGGFDAPGCI